MIEPHSFSNWQLFVFTGDATEDMVNTLDSGQSEDVDNEEVYKMANVMNQCDGLTIMLQR